MTSQFCSLGYSSILSLFKFKSQVSYPLNINGWVTWKPTDLRSSSFPSMEIQIILRMRLLGSTAVCGSLRIVPKSKKFRGVPFLADSKISVQLSGLSGFLVQRGFSGPCFALMGCFWSSFYYSVLPISLKISFVS